MNHLCNLDIKLPSLSLSKDDSIALEKFRNAYNAKRPPEIITEDVAVWCPDELPSCGWRALDDITLYRFLCADRRNDKFNHDASLERLLKTLLFRKEHGVDDILRAIITTKTKVEEKMNSPKKDNDDNRTGSISTSNNSTSSSPSSKLKSSFSIASGSMSECGSIVTDVVSNDNNIDNNNISNNQNEQQQQQTSGPNNNNNDNSQDEPQSSPSNDELILKLLPELEKYKRLRIRVFTGLDHEDRPVIFERLGEFLGSGTNQDQFTLQDWIKYYIWDFERHFVEMRNSSASSKKTITQFIIFMDATGLNRNCFKVLPLLKGLSQAVETHYPEIAGRIMLFNVPMIGTILYKAVKLFLDPITTSKIYLYNGIPMDEFLKHIPMDAIPQEYGGTCEVPFPKTSKE